MNTVLRVDDFESHLHHGNKLFSHGQYSEALKCFDMAIELNPDHGKAHNNRGSALYHLGRLEEALLAYENAIVLHPSFADGHMNLGNTLFMLGRYTEALAAYDRAQSLEPSLIWLHARRAQALSRLNRFSEALKSITRFLSHEKGYAEAYVEHGIILASLGRFQEASEVYTQAERIRPDFDKAFINHGNLLLTMGRFDEALQCFDRAIELTHSNEVAHNNKGCCLSETNRCDEAVAAFDRAIAIRPGCAEAYYNKGNALVKIKRLEDALIAYNKALDLKPGYADAFFGIGDCLFLLNKFEEAAYSFDKGLRLKPNARFALGTSLHLKMKTCDWDGFVENLEKLINEVKLNKPAANPFTFLGLVDSPDLQLSLAKNYAALRHAAKRSSGTIEHCRAANEKIKIGYYSSDFYLHATSHLIAEILELHDKSRFELHGFSFGHVREDFMRVRVRESFDKFYDVSGISDQEVAALSRKIGIDIAVDLKGYTTDSRPGIFAEGAAPIQVNYLGFPNTLGVDYVHYVIADSIVIPPEDRVHFSEKVVYLPNCYQPNDTKRPITDGSFSRKRLGLPEAGFVFCNFNSPYKLTPAWYDVWMQILRSVDGSVLWLLSDHPAIDSNLRKEAEARGVDGARIVFAERAPNTEHLARQRQADLFLDTLPCNAHTTASDALWAGLPILTCIGKSFSGRVASSLLSAIGMPEMIVQSRSEYIEKATELATNPGKLNTIKRKLADNRHSSPLFDSRNYTKHLEKAFEEMQARYLAGRPPEHFSIEK